MDLCLLASLYYLQLMWYPYYFMMKGLKSAAIYVSIMPCIGNPIGSLIFGFLIEKFHLSSRWLIPLSLSISLIIQVYLCFTNISEGNTWVWMILVGIVAMFQGHPWGYLTSTEFQLRTQTNRQKYIIMAFARSVYNFVTFVLLILIGFSMEKSNYFSMQICKASCTLSQVSMQLI